MLELISEFQDADTPQSISMKTSIPSIQCLKIKRGYLKQKRRAPKPLFEAVSFQDDEPAPNYLWSQTRFMDTIQDPYLSVTVIDLAPKPLRSRSLTRVGGSPDLNFGEVWAMFSCIDLSLLSTHLQCFQKFRRAR